MVRLFLEILPQQQFSIDNDCNIFNPFFIIKKTDGKNIFHKKSVEYYKLFHIKSVE